MSSVRCDNVMEWNGIVVLGYVIYLVCAVCEDCEESLKEGAV